MQTWDYGHDAIDAAYSELMAKDNPIDAITTGCTVAESMADWAGVGFGGKPDEKGEVSLDAIIMDGVTMNVGAVGNVRRIKSVAKVASLGYHFDLSC